MSPNDSPQCIGWRRHPGELPERCTAPATRKITIAAADNGDLPDYLRDLAPETVILCEDCAAEYREHNGHRILSDEPIDGDPDDDPNDIQARMDDFDRCTELPAHTIRPPMAKQEAA
jgi:hypothetical protein